MYNKTLINYDFGCVYKLDADQELMYAPLKAGTNQPAREFDYVDFMALLGEESNILDAVHKSENELRVLNGLSEIKMWQLADCPQLVPRG